MDRRREPADRSRAIPYAQLERLWRREDVAVREKALWRLLYETAARASEILSLNIEDIDRDNRRAVVRSKGGDIDLLHFQTGSARLIPRLIGDRPRGPLFLTDRRPPPGRAPALVDICPFTGRARLSYRRAEEIFHAASGGWTLHQLRHSAITTPRRGQRRVADAHGQEPPHQPAVAAEVCATERGGSCRADRRTRSRAPAPVVVRVMKACPVRD